VFFQEKPVRGFKEPVQEEWERTLRHHLERTLPERCPRHLNFIREWLKDLKVTDYRKPLAVVKLILKYLYLKADKTRYLKLYEKFKISSIEPKPPEVLPRPVILRMLEQMPLKWKAFYSLMYKIGCRVSEARALKIKTLSYCQMDLGNILS